MLHCYISDLNLPNTNPQDRRFQTKQQTQPPPVSPSLISQPVPRQLFPNPHAHATNCRGRRPLLLRRVFSSSSGAESGLNPSMSVLEVPSGFRRLSDEGTRASLLGGSVPISLVSLPCATRLLGFDESGWSLDALQSAFCRLEVCPVGVECSYGGVEHSLGCGHGSEVEVFPLLVCKFELLGGSR